MEGGGGGGEGQQDLIQIKGPCVPGFFFAYPVKTKIPQASKIDYIMLAWVKFKSSQG